MACRGAYGRERPRNVGDGLAGGAMRQQATSERAARQIHHRGEGDDASSSWHWEGDVPTGTAPTTQNRSTPSALGFASLQLTVLEPKHSTSDRCTKFLDSGQKKITDGHYVYCSYICFFVPCHAIRKSHRDRCWRDLQPVEVPRAAASAQVPCNLTLQHCLRKGIDYTHSRDASATTSSQAICE